MNINNIFKNSYLKYQGLLLNLGLLQKALLEIKETYFFLFNLHFYCCCLFIKLKKVLQILILFIFMNDFLNDPSLS